MLNVHAQQLLDSGDKVALVLRRAQSLSLVGDWVEQLINWAMYMRINRNLAINSVENYVRAVTDFLVYLKSNGRTIESAAGCIDDWQQEMAMDGKVSATRSMSLTGVRQFYHWRAMQGLPGADPTAGIKGPKLPKRTPRKLSDDQMSSLLLAPDQKTTMGRRDFAILLFFVSTGARLSEVVSLDVHQLVMRQSTGLVRFKGKGDKERMVSFEGPVVTALQDWLIERDKYVDMDEQAVFLCLRAKHKGKRLGRSGIGLVLARAMKTAGLRKLPDDPFGLHRIRAVFATKMYDYHKDIELVAQLLGHDDINTTRKYIVISDTLLKTRMPSSYTEGLLGKTKPVPRYVKAKIGHREKGERL